MDYDDKRVRRLKLLVIAAVVLVILFLIVSFVRLRKFHVVSTNPKTSAVSSIAPFFKINFNKQLVKSSVEVTSSPKVIAAYSVEGKTLDISLLSMNLNKSYTITINSITATDREMIKDESFHFVTKNISGSALPKDQQQAILKNQQHYSAVASDPIMSHLPHETLNYTLSAHLIQGTNGKSQLILLAAIRLNQVDMSNEDAAIANYKQQVISYIQSLGLNPANYTIDYTVSAP